MSKRTFEEIQKNIESGVKSGIPRQVLISSLPEENAVTYAQGISRTTASPVRGVNTAVLVTKPQIVQAKEDLKKIWEERKVKNQSLTYEAFANSFKNDPVKSKIVRPYRAYISGERRVGTTTAQLAVTTATATAKLTAALPPAQTPAPQKSMLTVAAQTIASGLSRILGTSTTPAQVTTPTQASTSSVQATTVLTRPQQFATFLGFCPLRNGSNWCFLNASIQMFHDIPELRAFFQTVTDQQIDASGTLFIDGQDTTQTKQILKLLKIIFDAMEENIAAKETTELNFVRLNNELSKNKQGNPIEEMSIKGPSGNPAYYDFIDAVTRPEELKLPEQGRPFVVKKQADADEFVDRVLAKIFSSNFNDLQVLRYLTSYLRVNNTICKPKESPRFVETGFEMTQFITIQLFLGYDQKNGTPIFIKTMKEGIEKVEGVDLFDFNTDNCTGTFGPYGLGRQSNIELLKTTKYVVVKISRKYIDERTGLDRLTNTRVPVESRLTIGGAEFQPRGVIVHRGSVGGGHYFYYHFENGLPTILCDDSSCTKVTQYNSREIHTGGRIILYERVDPADTVTVATQAVTTIFPILTAKKVNYNRALSIENKKTRDIEKSKTMKNIYTTITHVLRKPVGQGTADTGKAQQEALERAFAEAAAIVTAQQAAQAKEAERDSAAVAAVSKQTAATTVQNTGAGTGLSLSSTSEPNNNSNTASVHTNVGQTGTNNFDPTANNNLYKGGKRRKTRKSKGSKKRHTRRKH